ncbi:membrane-anchored junction protein isoform X2 [Taeniopygia guttata]|uniref:membrane-anchored junction protein isoform X2 n=1 Tax=Taeniopygia guttata TaxID=59729 RepID=UPI003BB86609
MSLKPFTFPLPETRFLHAGRHVYKFKIRYGNFNSSPILSLTESAAKELEEVIRVILGNLDDLHPFSTHHFTIFPYLSKWERVSKMKFKHENVHLMPYPYICTLYLELNSFQRSISCGKEVNKGSDELVRRRNEISETTAMKEAVKRRRVEVRDDTSCPESCIDSYAVRLKSSFRLSIFPAPGRSVSAVMRPALCLLSRQALLLLNCLGGFGFSWGATEC